MVEAGGRRCAVGSEVVVDDANLPMKTLNPAITKIATVTHTARRVGGRKRLAVVPAAGKLRVAMAQRYGAAKRRSARGGWSVAKVVQGLQEDER